MGKASGIPASNCRDGRWAAIGEPMGEPVWRNPELIAKDDVQYGFDETHADRFLNTLAQRLEVDSQNTIAAYEDAWYYLWKERRLPDNVDPFDSKLEMPEERARLAKSL